jgi:hypothetical protein
MQKYHRIRRKGMYLIEILLFENLLVERKTSRENSLIQVNKLQSKGNKQGT